MYLLDRKLALGSVSISFNKLTGLDNSGTAIYKKLIISNYRDVHNYNALIMVSINDDGDMRGEFIARDIGFVTPMATIDTSSLPKTYAGSDQVYGVDHGWYSQVGALNNREAKLLGTSNLFTVKYNP